MKNERTRKELTVVRTHFIFGTDDSYFYFKDSDGNIYCWNTRSEKAFEEMQEGTTHRCSFSCLESYILHGNTINKIERVRF